MTRSRPFCAVATASIIDRNLDYYDHGNWCDGAINIKVASELDANGSPFMVWNGDNQVPAYRMETWQLWSLDTYGQNGTPILIDAGNFMPADENNPALLISDHLIGIPMGGQYAVTTQVDWSGLSNENGGWGNAWAGQYDYPYYLATLNYQFDHGDAVLGAMTLTDASDDMNSVGTMSGWEPPTLALTADNAGQAKFQLNVAGLGDSVVNRLWEVRNQADQIVAQGGFPFDENVGIYQQLQFLATGIPGGGNSSDPWITVTPVNAGTTTYIVYVGHDDNENGVLDDESETWLTANVQVEETLALTGMTLSNNANAANTLTIQDATHTGTIYLAAAPGATSATATLSALYTPTNMSDHFVWHVTGNNASAGGQTSGTFANGNPSITFTPTGGNLNYVVQVGVDSDDVAGWSNGDTMLYTMNVGVNIMRSMTVADTHTGGFSATTTDSSVVPDLYIDKPSTTAATVQITPDMWGTTAEKAKVKWNVIGAGATPASGDFTGATLPVVTLDGSASNSWIWLFTQWLDADGDGVNNHGEPELHILVHVRVSHLASAAFDATVATRFHPIAKDDGSGDYGSVQWVDNNLDGYANDAGESDFPICLTRSGTASGDVKLKAVLSVHLASGTGITTMGIRGTAAMGTDWTGTFPQTNVTLAAGATAATFTIASTTAIPNYVRMDDLHVQWEYTTDGGTTWEPLAETVNRTYITRDDPIVAAHGNPYETSLYIGCTAARGSGPTDTEWDALQAIWHLGFTNTDAETPRPKNVVRADGTPLHYYGDMNTPYQTLAELLKNGDGRCTTWAQLLIATLQAQNVHTKFSGTTPSYADDYVQIFAAPSTGFLINNWDFLQASAPGVYYNVPDPSVGTDPWKTIKTVGGVQSWAWLHHDVDDASGSDGQNTSNPLSLFPNHQLVRIYDADGNISWLDPSYGQIYTSLANFEYCAVTGYYKTRILNESEVNIDLNNNGNKTDTAIKTYEIAVNDNGNHVKIAQSDTW